MTIDEMRHLHRRALSEAEAKRTELRLVLASRYRELVGSSDEVLRMKERAKELHELIHAIPDLLHKLDESSSETATTQEDEESKDDALVATTAETKQSAAVEHTRRQLSELTRSIHRALDRNHVHLATTTLMKLFCVIAAHTDEYPLANTLAAAHQQQESILSGSDQNALVNTTNVVQDPTLQAQMRMIYFQVQTLPRKILQSSKENLLAASSYENPLLGAERSAAALASMDVLSGDKNTDRASYLLDTYFDSKATLLGSLFNQLTVKAAHQAEEILSKIVLILQHDIIVHPYEIFILRKFPGDNAQAIMETLPLFNPAAVQSKCSKFLAAHLPNIRTKTKSVLVSIAGTTASALGQIRQSLYDKTDGSDCQRALSEANPVCTWDEAVSAVVDVRQVLSHSERSLDRKFSLWSALFSHTFSSLVHSLLTTSFHSVHAKVVSTLRASLAQAPPLAILLPHEAYRNTLRIATDLDQALIKVSDDAHELLVHAEEREESERRLKQSLYVQTCEILGRLLCEVRRIVTEGQKDELSDGTREFIVGRLCHFLKFRLSSLPALLDPDSSPVKTGSSGMISYADLESAFSLADDNDDGLISFAEAMDATESAFSGTQFHGSEMLRGTLLLSSSKVADGKDTNMDVTLNELMLLTARGLRHGNDAYSALGMVQKALDDIVASCFQGWADAALRPSVDSLNAKIGEFWETATSTTDSEWQTVHGDSSGGSGGLDSINGISPPTVGFVMSASFVLNQTMTPADSLPPVSSNGYAEKQDTSLAKNIPTLADTLRWNLLARSLHLFCNAWAESLSKGNAANANPSALLQFYLDATFVRYCYMERNQHGFDSDQTKALSSKLVGGLVQQSDKLVSKVCSRAVLLSLPSKVSQKHRQVDESCDLFVSSLFGRQAGSSAVSTAGDMDLGDTNSVHPFFYPPLSSTRRFALLPIQTDRTLTDLQLKGAFKKDKEDQEGRRNERIGGSVMSSGLGFFSSMLKKK